MFFRPRLAARRANFRAISRAISSATSRAMHIENLESRTLLSAFFTGAFTDNPNVPALAQIGSSGTVDSQLTNTGDATSSYPITATFFLETTPALGSGDISFGEASTDVTSIGMGQTANGSFNFSVP